MASAHRRDLVSGVVFSKWKLLASSGGGRLVFRFLKPRRFVSAVAIVLSLGANAVFGQATSVTLQLFPLTGEVRLINENADPFSFTFYELESPSGALNGTAGVWTSISSTYDASGNEFIDPVSDWVELSFGPTNLSEATFGVGGTLPAFRGISLGNIWNSSLVATPDIIAKLVLPNDQPATVFVRQMLDGDYFRDGMVNATDFQFWKAFIGSTTAPFADGNLNGIVDAADYSIWRDNFGTALPGIGAGQVAAEGLGSVRIVPEPIGLFLLLSGGGILFGRWRRIR